MAQLVKLSDVLSGVACAVGSKLQNASDKRALMDFVEQTVNSAIAGKMQGKLPFFKDSPLKEDYALQALMRSVYNAIRYNEKSVNKLVENAARAALSGWSGDELAKVLGGDYFIF